MHLLQFPVASASIRLDTSLFFMALRSVVGIFQFALFISLIFRETHINWYPKKNIFIIRHFGYIQYSARFYLNGMYVSNMVHEEVESVDMTTFLQ